MLLISKQVKEKIATQVITPAQVNIYFNDATSMQNISILSITLQDDATNYKLLQLISFSFILTEAKTISYLDFLDNANNILFRIETTMSLDPAEHYLTVILEYAYNIL